MRIVITVPRRSTDSATPGGSGEPISRRVRRRPEDVAPFAVEESGDARPVPGRGHVRTTRLRTGTTRSAPGLGVPAHPPRGLPRLARARRHATHRGGDDRRRADLLTVVGGRVLAQAGRQSRGRDLVDRGGAELHVQPAEGRRQRAALDLCESEGTGPVVTRIRPGSWDSDRRERAAALRRPATGPRGAARPRAGRMPLDRTRPSPSPWCTRRRRLRRDRRALEARFAGRDPALAAHRPDGVPRVGDPGGARRGRRLCALRLGELARWRHRERRRLDRPGYGTPSTRRCRADPSWAGHHRHGTRCRC